MGQARDWCLVPLVVAFGAWWIYWVAYLKVGGMALGTCSVGDVRTAATTTTGSCKRAANVCIPAVPVCGRVQLECDDDDDATAYYAPGNRFACTYALTKEGTYYLLDGDYVTFMARWLLANEIISGACAVALVVIALLLKTQNTNDA